jgi:hypothetical protein
MDAGGLATGRVCTEFPKDKEFRAFEMLEEIEFSLKPRRCGMYQGAFANKYRVRGRLPAPMNEGLTPAMTNPMSNIVFDMAAATLSNGNLRGDILNAPAPR